MRKLILWFLFLFVGVALGLTLTRYAHGQDQPARAPAVKEEAKKPAADSPPVLSDEARASIRELQLQQARIVVDFLNRQHELEQLGQQNQNLMRNIQSQLQAQQDKVDKDKKTWVLNPETLKFEKPPAPSTQPPTPPKPAEKSPK